MDVIIVGAGLSGLTSAAILYQAGVTVQVIEAANRIGGRIQAVLDPDTNRPLADLGPTWVWPKYQPVATQWIERLGVGTFEQFNDGDAVILGYGPAPHRQPLPGQDGMVRLVGGPTALIDALSDQIPDDIVRTSTTVTAIRQEDAGRVAVHLNDDQVITADKVIVSVPLRGIAASVQMPWAPASLIAAMQQTPTWMSTHAKAVALYERPFWRDAGLSGRIASRTGPLVEAHDHSAYGGAPGAIFGFVGWPPERRRSDPEALRTAILAQLVECFGAEAAQPSQLVIEDWALSRHIVTDRDLTTPPDHPDVGPHILRAPHLDGRVYFSASETSDISPGLIEGAFASGERAAHAVLGTQR